MDRSPLTRCLAVALGLLAATTLRAELDSFDRWQLDNAKREWRDEQRRGFDLRVQQNDYRIKDALRRGEQGDLLWKNDFDRLIEERQRTRRNLEAIQRATDDWERERRRGSDNRTAPLDRRIRNTLDNAAFDDSGLWQNDFDSQMRRRRDIRRDSESRHSLIPMPPPGAPAPIITTPPIDDPLDDGWLVPIH